ncbi:heterokaryon incompatibility protein-domain-containing protein [Tricladium varicosporioides]|nr:heterokaryon incompatibility protein-domain-containing protein [Hymenoscyphus varicosporioides]
MAVDGYRYYPLSLGHHIRLLRLFPSEDQNEPIQCQLFDYSLQDLGKRTHPYEALSYVWGKPDQTLPIYVDGVQFPVTVNLHAALLRLRHQSIERILWADAICINQENKPEKEQQIQFMAKIYAQAKSVLVWLGEAADNSDRALDEIRVAGGKGSTNPSNSDMIQQAIIALLDRPWFRRIWVLQEVAAARHVSILCGSEEIDGYAFCLGVESLKYFYEDCRNLHNLIPSVTYLIRGAIFRPKYTTSQARVSLNIRPLSELIDMYYTHEATDHRDKVFALLGMSSDNDIAFSLSPDYETKWEQLFERLIKFLLYKDVFVETWYDRDIAVVKSKGCILGQVASVRNSNKQDAIITSTSVAWYLGDEVEWALSERAKPIQKGDIVCLLQGASKATIIRLCKDCFAIVVIAVTPLKEKESSKRLELSKSITHFPRDFLLFWDWEQLYGKSFAQGD